MQKKTIVYQVGAGKGGVGKTTTTISLCASDDKANKDFEKLNGRKLNYLIFSHDKNGSLMRIFDANRQFGTNFKFHNNVMIDYFDDHVLDQMNFANELEVDIEIDSRLYLDEDGAVKYIKKNYVEKTEEELEAETNQKIAVIDTELNNGKALRVECSKVISEFEKISEISKEKGYAFITEYDESIASFFNSLEQNIDQSLDDDSYFNAVYDAVSNNYSDFESVVKTTINNNVSNGVLREKLISEIKLSNYKYVVEGEYTIDKFYFDTPANYKSKKFAQDHVFIVHSMNELVSYEQSIEDMQAAIDAQILPYVEHIQSGAISVEDIILPKFYYVMNIKKDSSSYLTEQNDKLFEIEIVKRIYKEEGIDVDIKPFVLPYVYYDQFFKFKINPLQDIEEVNKDRNLVKAQIKEEQAKVRDTKLQLEKKLKDEGIDSLSVDELYEYLACKSITVNDINFRTKTPFEKEEFVLANQQLLANEVFAVKQ